VILAIVYKLKYEMLLVVKASFSVTSVTKNRDYTDETLITQVIKVTVNLGKAKSLIHR